MISMWTAVSDLDYYEQMDEFRAMDVEAEDDYSDQPMIHLSEDEAADLMEVVAVEGDFSYYDQQHYRRTFKLGAMRSVPATSYMRALVAPIVTEACPF